MCSTDVKIQVKIQVMVYSESNIQSSHSNFPKKEKAKKALFEEKKSTFEEKNSSMELTVI